MTKEHMLPSLACIVLALAMIAMLIPAARSSVLSVDDEPGRWADFNSIHDALNASQAGDEIQIHSGHYQAGFIVGKSITISGNNSRETVLLHRGHGPAVTVISDNASITNLSIMSPAMRYDSIGVLIRSDHVNLTNCNITGHAVGVRLQGADNCTVSGLSLWNNSVGINILRSDGNTIENCTIATDMQDAMYKPEENGIPRDVVHFAVSADQHYGRSTENPTNPYPPYDDDSIDDWMVHKDLPEMDFTIASIGDWISDRRTTGVWEEPDFCWQKATRNNADHHRIPYFWTVGNHDITNYEKMTDGNPLRKLMMAKNISGLVDNNFAFMYNNVLFINAAQTNALFTLSHFQRHWIEHLVDRYENHTTVIFSHQATYETTGRNDGRATSWDGNDYKVHNDYEWWRDLFDDNPQIALYIHGHTEHGHNTTFLDGHNETWDDDCLFVLVPSNRQDCPHFDDQKGWSYIFTIADGYIEVKCWDSMTESWMNDTIVGVPYTRSGMDNDVTDAGMEWLSIPKKVMDGQAWTWRNHYYARSYRVELIGSNITEQIDNPDLSGCYESDEIGGVKAAYWYAVRGDETASNLATGEEDGFIAIEGNTTLELAMSPTTEKSHIEGKVPWNTAIAVPGREYRFSVRLKAEEYAGTADFLISLPKYLDIENFVWEDHEIRSNFTVTTNFGTYSKRFILPDDEDMWFVQPKIHLDNGTNFTVTAWSLKRIEDWNTTSNFSLTINGVEVEHQGALANQEVHSYSLDNTTMESELDFNCSIGGNKVGHVELVYERPLLWSDDVVFGVNEEDQSRLYIEDVSPYNNRTSVMSFERTNRGIMGFDMEVVRGKHFYHNIENDVNVNRNYSVYRQRRLIGLESINSYGNIIDRVRVQGYYIGIELNASESTTIINSSLKRCTSFGISLVNASMNNTVLNNNLRCELNALDLGLNTWNGSEGIGGNFWSDYAGNDNDGDMVGDTPYNVTGGPNADSMPFMVPSGWLWAFNSAPLADAGGNHTLHAGVLFVLNGSGSFDLNGDDMSYRWELISQPVLSSSYIENSTRENATLDLDAVGTYEVKLTVNDSAEEGSDTVYIESTNIIPTASAGRNSTAYVNQTLFMNGSAFDGDGDPLVWNWSVAERPVGSGAFIMNSTKWNASIRFDIEGTYSLCLQVEDEWDQSEPSYITITVVNRPPRSDFTYQLQAVAEGCRATFTDCSEDEDGWVVSWHWDMGDGSEYNGRNVTHVFTQDATVQVSLVVEDDSENVDDRIITIEVDANPPDIIATYDEKKGRIILQAIDGIDKSPEMTLTAKAGTLRTYSLEDELGHTSGIVLRKKKIVTYSVRYTLTTFRVSFKQTEYDGQGWSDCKANRMVVTLRTKNIGHSFVLRRAEALSYGDGWLLSSLYKKKLGRTTVMINDGEFHQSTINGLRVPEVFSWKGDILFVP